MSKIDPSTPHPEYDRVAQYSSICHDAYIGDVRKYVLQLGGQTTQEYEQYTSRAAYYNLVDKTTHALLGALTRKPYVLEGMEFPQNSAGSADVFMQTVYKHILLGGKVGIMVDVLEDGTSYLLTVPAENIINWSDTYVMIANSEMVSDPENPYKQSETVYYHELYLDAQGVYQNRYWRQVGKNKAWQAEQGETMIVNGQPLDYIPFWIANSHDNTWNTYRPPLLTQSSLNIQHFRQACDLAHYAHFMAFPTFTLEGSMQQYTDINGNVTEAKIRLGSTTDALHITQGSRAYYAEVSGVSFKMLQDELANIEERLALSGSRLLTTKKGVESVDALQLRAANEGAVLISMANSVETAINAALRLCAEIERVNPETVYMELNKDFTAEPLDPNTVKTLLELYQAGAITLDQLLAELYRGEVVDAAATSRNQVETLEMDIPVA